MWFQFTMRLSFAKGTGDTSIVFIFSFALHDLRSNLYIVKTTTKIGTELIRMYIRNRIKSWVCRASVDLMEKIHLQCFNLCRSVCSRCCAHASMSSEFLVLLWVEFKKEKTLNFDSNERNYVIETIRWSGVLDFSIVNNAPKWSKIGEMVCSWLVKISAIIRTYLWSTCDYLKVPKAKPKFWDLINFWTVFDFWKSSVDVSYLLRVLCNTKQYRITNRLIAKKKHFTFNGLILVYKSHSRSPTTHKHSFTMRWCLIFVSFASVSFVLFSWRIVFIFV